MMLQGKINKPKLRHGSSTMASQRVPCGGRVGHRRRPGRFRDSGLRRADGGSGPIGAEFHLNHFFVGSTSFEGPEQPTNHVTHLTFEPHIGLADWCEAGAYVSTAVRASGTFDVASLKLRFKARWPTRLWGRLGLALNQELSATRLDYEASGFAWEIRPVIDFEWRRLVRLCEPHRLGAVGGARQGQA